MKRNKNISSSENKIHGNILIVEDNADSRFLLTDLLQSSGHKVLTATNGLEVLDLINDEVPDLVLMDIMLPDITGYEVASKLKANPKTNSVPIIFTSALVDIADKIKAFQTGGVDYITKPLVLEEVLIRVNTHLEISHLRSTLRQNASELQNQNELFKHEISERKITVKRLEETLAEIDINKTAALNLMEDLSDEVALRKKNEEALLESEQRFRGFIENASDLVFSLDLKGIFTYVSPNKKDYKTDFVNDAIGKSFERYIYSEDIPICREFLNTVIQTRESCTSKDYRALQKDRSVRWHSSRGSVQYDKDGNVTGIMGIARDVTDRKLIEESVRQSEEKFRNIFELSRVGKSMTGIDGSMHINDAFCNIVGYSKEELSGYKWKEITHPDDVENDQKMLAMIISGEKTSIRWEKRYIHKKGHIVWVDISTILQRDKEGKPLYFITSIIDISASKFATKALEQSEEKFRKAFLTSPDAITINRMDDGLYVSINKGYTHILGFTEKDVTGKTSSEIKIWKNPKDRERLIEGLKTKGWVDNLEAEFIKKNGETVVGLMSASIIDLESVTHILAITRDISQRKKAEEENVKISKHYRALIEKAPDGIALLNTEMKFSYISPSAKRMFGYGESDILTDDPNEHTHPDDLAIILPELGKILDDASYTPTLQYRFAEKNGNWKWIESTFTNLLHDSSVESIVINFRDVNDRKKAEEQLFSIATRQEAILAAVPDIIMEVDNNKVYTWANNHGIDFFGEDVIGKEASHFFEGKQETLKTIEPLFNGKEDTLYLESWQKRKDGQERLLAWWCQVLLDENGMVKGALSSARDITENKQSEIKIKEQLEELRKWYEATLDRESRVMELKMEVNELLKKMGESIRYESVT